MSLSDIHPATAKAGPELDALMATEVRGCAQNAVRAAVDGVDTLVFNDQMERWEPFHPSTNAVDAGELRRTAERVDLYSTRSAFMCHIHDPGRDVVFAGRCKLSETNNDLSTPEGLQKAKRDAEALAVCRAWLAYLKAKGE